MSHFKHEWIPKYFPDKPPSVMFDVGSFDGGSAFRIMDECPSLITHAFEAGYRNALRLNSRASDRFLPHHFAISDELGWMTFYASYGRHPVTGYGYPGSGSLLKPTDHVSEKYNGMKFKEETVKVITLDWYCNKFDVRPDIIHADVQGSELKIMQGLTVCDPRMVFLEVGADEEYEEAVSPEVMESYMGQRGYELADTISDPPDGPPTDHLYVKR
jgi:FkbM family methyltransferase